MSVNVRIRTNYRSLDFEQVVRQLAAEGYGLIVRFINPEICEFYQHQLSTRPIDLSLEDNGYEVRITTLACREDYELFAKTIAIVREQTNGHVYYEDDDDGYVDDVTAFFDSEWIESQMKGDAKLINTFVLGEHVNDPAPERMHEVGLYGPVGMFYVGENLLGELGININSDWHEISEKLIGKFRYSQYARPSDIRRTTTSMAISFSDDDSDDEDNGMNNKLTYYRQNCYDMISRTDYFALIAHDEKSFVIKYEDFMKIVPQQWERFDNCQYFTSPLTDKQFKDFWDRAREYRLGQNAEELEYNEKDDQAFGLKMAKAWFFADADYVRGRIKKQDLPPCANAEPKPGDVPPVFYAIAKCQEIIFGSDSYSPEYIPVVSEMRKRTKAMLDFWEKEMGIPEWDSIPFREFSDMFDVPEEDATVADVMEAEAEDFREAGFSNSDLLLYMGAVKFDFKRVLDRIRAGADPDLELHPASDKQHVFCATYDMQSKAYSDFQYLYALYKWYIDTGEMVMGVSDCGRIISCAAHMKMYAFMNEHRQSF